MVESLRGTFSAARQFGGSGPLQAFSDFSAGPGRWDRHAIIHTSPNSIVLASDLFIPK